jgi:hypothetical protein
MLNRANLPQTIGPLHLEDLEARRFKNVIRQLIYDFRNGQMLEATGRSGRIVDSTYEASKSWPTSIKLPTARLADGSRKASVTGLELRQSITECEDTESETMQYGDSSLAIILFCFGVGFLVFRVGIFVFGPL